MGLWSIHHMLSLLLFPPQGEDSSCTSPASVWVPHGVMSCQQTYSRGCSGSLLLHGLQRHSCLTMGCTTRLQGDLCSSAWSISSPPSSLIGCLQGSSSHIFSLWLLLDRLSPHFLNLLSQRHYYHRCWAEPCPVVGPSGSWLPLPLWDMKKASSRSHSCSLLAT